MSRRNKIRQIYLIINKLILSLSLLSTLTTFAFLFMSVIAVALPEDNEQPITLQSNQAEFDRMNGTTTYSGKVVMEQGSMRIEADKVIIYGDLKQATRVVATGKPARFSQTPEVGAKPVIATGHRLEYEIQKKQLELAVQAKLEQDGSILSGPKIVYDVERAVVRAGETETLNDGDRVRMVIPPQAK